MPDLITNAAEAIDILSAHMEAKARVGEEARLCGRYTAVFRAADGTLIHEEEFDNLITNVGVALMLDTMLAGSAYTVVGPFMGLIGAASLPTVANADTMASHSGWLESGGANPPTMSSTRLTCAWSAAVAATRNKSLSANLTFTFTGSGTIQGAFLVTGSGAVSTVGSTAGTLFSAGLLSAAQPVIATNTLALGWVGTLT